MDGMQIISAICVVLNILFIIDALYENEAFDVLFWVLILLCNVVGVIG